MRGRWVACGNPAYAYAYYAYAFHRFVGQGEYPADWGGVNPCPGLAVPE